jgi:predicted DNA binding CopG/RHH family protein
VLEVSFPSTLHIGHELSLALEKGRPVVALYHKGKEPSFFLGLQEDKIFWGDYVDYDLEEVVREGIEYADSQTETRFNLFLSPKHVAHLENKAKETKLPRSSYIRMLIDEDIKSNKNE